MWLHTRMTKKILALLAIVSVTVFVSGCYHTPDGRSRVGVPLKDSFESRYQRTVPQILTAAKEVLSHNGTLTMDNSVNHTLEAKVDGRDVVVKVDEVEPGISRVLVQARTKAHAPDLDLAAEIDKQIALRLR
jgi:hypothetical protein